MEKIEYDDLWGEDENGRPKEPFEEILKKLNTKQKLKPTKVKELIKELKIGKLVRLKM